MNIIIKRFIAFALSFTLVIVPSFAVYDPNPKHSKWFHDSIVNDPTVKSTVEVKAQRTYPVVVYDPETGSKNTINKPQKTSIKVLANVNKVGKKLLKGGAHAAIGAAVYDILLKSVDWVLDPENNRIKYTDPTDIGRYSVLGSSKIVNSPQAVCEEYVATKGGSRCFDAYVSSETKYVYACWYNTTSETGGTKICGTRMGEQLDVDPDEAINYIPIDTVAQKVIEHANEGQAPAMQVMTDTALDALEAGELDNDLEAGAEPKQYGPNEYAPGTEPNPEPDPENPDPENPDPENPDPNPNPEPTPTEWPAFCDWATPVCDFIEWVKAEPEQTDTEIDLQESDEEPTDTNFDFGGSCPAPIVFEGSIFGQSIEFTMLDTVMLCDFLSTYVKWPVYAASSLFAIYIVGGRKEDG